MTLKPDENGVFERVWPGQEGPDKKLQRDLLQAGRTALWEEDKALAAAFDKASPEVRKAYQQPPAANEGLGYWLFETTLVYTIFKAWIPLAHTWWEGRYQDTPGRTADLVVHPEAGNLDRKWGFEAKWWPSMQAKWTNAVFADAEKLLRWRGLEERYLLTFWITEPGLLDKDVREVESVCGKPRSGLDFWYELDLAYLGTFRTHIAPRRAEESKPHLFAFCALRVQERA